MSKLMGCSEQGAVPGEKQPMAGLAVVALGPRVSSGERPGPGWVAAVLL